MEAALRPFAKQFLRSCRAARGSSEADGAVGDHLGTPLERPKSPRPVVPVTFVAFIYTSRPMIGCS
jgi:hypothetical protein